MDERALKHLLEIMFIPPHHRLQGRKLPHAIDLGIVVLVRRMRVALQLDGLQISRRVDLVRGAQLVVADDPRVGDALPARGAEEVLRLDARVAEEVVVRHHGEEVA